MALIHNITQKIRTWGQTIRVHAHTEMLKCRICGAEYFSRGKYDPGICRECERERNANCVGGVYDGEPAHKNHEEN